MNATLPTRIGRAENELRTTLSCGVQIHEAAPCSRISNPIVATTTVSTPPRAIGRMTTRSTAIPPANPIAIVAKNAAQ